MSRHLTHRFWFCATIGFGTAAISLLARSLEPFALGAPFLGVLLLSAIDGWWQVVDVGSPSVSSPRVIEGDELAFSMTLSAVRPVPWVELEVQFPATLDPTGPARFVVSLEGERQFTIPVRATRWGSAGPEWAVVTTRDRFGVSELVARYPIQLPVRIHPPSERLSSLVALHRQRPVTGEHRSRRLGPGAELAEVRPYRFGDPIRMIHPRLTARHLVPMIVERHPDQSSDVILLIDSAQDLGVDLDTTLRWTVTAATALTERHLRAQDRVGMIDLGRGVRWLPAQLGRRHLHTMVDALLSTEVLPRNQYENAFLIPTNLPRSATIIAISPLLTELVLTALVDLRSRGHEVIVIKPSVPDNMDDADISLLAHRIFRVGNALNEAWLVDRGSVVIPWSTGDSLEHLMHRVVGNLGRARQR
ncbi:MAG: DUF58 domain-containing protein [Actinomycetia bacterium]|nr:DUF58 domain-containing protein [Actinomycetes bacterium]MCP5034172.1 DUF58 domain-containing protein [Actinomycetes bacterium]